MSAVILGLHLATAHLGPFADTKSPINPGIYVRAESGLTAGVYRNSVHRLSSYAGWTWETPNGRFALTVGAVSGYQDNALSPLIVPSMRMQLGDSLAGRISYLPKPPKFGGAAGIHFSLERKW